VETTQGKRKLPARVASLWKVFQVQCIKVTELTLKVVW